MPVRLTDTILAVEDFEDDIVALKRTLRKAEIEHPLKVVTDGQQAIDYLAGRGAYSDRDTYPLPFLILLDLKLPLVSGFEVLAWIRSQPHLGSVKVAILSGSDERRDHDEAARLGVQTYLVKPATQEQIKGLLSAVPLPQAF
jgi:CheY-like chemotaxis protein